ncbi:alkaline exonuclease-helicase 2 fusion protein [Epinotia aporema granulovirus]|uniref:Alkaline exonuclease-helicase 2 fusion protein n=1 Tax=Epinotia aporema granulovirus TaxID=166056 RepID=K4ERV5_9BBAC|nr:alkaline exonuclease-helicase 2 fusion protein [Epinotia aporema granulovirus]AER41545.1 alkaline exonuclease-helicase 2 fusion protein [Epinotia aporema granulovirus]
MHEFNESLTAEQNRLADKYCLQNYVSNLTLDYRNSKQEIFELEKATRGQGENELWKLLRINRTTASNSGHAFYGGENEAMRYGLDNEKLLKQNAQLIDLVCARIEHKTKQKVVERVLDCGMFITELGLYSASPDAYFLLENNAMVVMEIKCPYTYRSETLFTIRDKFNNRNRYRVPHTAFSVNRHGEYLNVLVEKNNDHYRQMQAQMYVTNAVFAVYMVKIGQDHEMHFVERDNEHINKMKKKELAEFKNYTNQNNSYRCMIKEQSRYASFDSAVEEQMRRKLAKNGLYNKHGVITCYFCKSQFEINNAINHDCGTKQDNVIYINVDNISYINERDRIDNLLNSANYCREQATALAKSKFYWDGTQLRLYCCGQTDLHAPNCSMKRSDEEPVPSTSTSTQPPPVKRLKLDDETDFDEIHRKFMEDDELVEMESVPLTRTIEPEETVESIAEHLKQYDEKFNTRLVKPVTLNQSQQKLFDYVVSRQEFEPIFVSGSAGTGKSALLLALQKRWEDDKKIVMTVAYTHMAARNVNGTTCHSAFGFDFNLNLKSYICNPVPNYLIIDEISMIPDKMLNGIDEKLRYNTGVDKPFGGVNVIVFGDLYQLPPINDEKKNNFKPPFYSRVWNSLSLYELTENMRQTEAEFIANLNMLRVGDIRCKKFFDKLVTKPPLISESVKCTTLVPLNYKADIVNINCYKYIRGLNKKAEEYTVKIEQHILRKTFENSRILFTKKQEEMIFQPGMKFCVGTRIMATQNINGFCNGDVGIVTEVDPEVGPLIKREHDGRSMWLTKATVMFSTDDKQYVKMITGLPMRYGWGGTVHKNQGMTVINLIVNPDKVFVNGQAYVALSRVTHCSGLKLISPIPERHISVMNDVTKIYESMNKLVVE